MVLLALGAVESGSAFVPAARTVAAASPGHPARSFLGLSARGAPAAAGGGGDDDAVLAEFKRAMVWDRYRNSLVEEVVQGKRGGKR